MLPLKVKRITAFSGVTLGGQTLFSFPAGCCRKEVAHVQKKAFRLFICYMCSSFAVHLLHKSVLTAWLAPNGQLFFSYLTGLTAVAASLYIYIKAYAPALSRRQGRGVLFAPVMPHSVVSCRICSFYIKFHKAEPFQPYSMPFDTFYSNLKYSHTILTRSVKNRLNCRYAGGQLRRIRRRP